MQQLNHEFVPAIATLLGCQVETLPYQVAGEAVYELRLEAEALAAPLRLVLWPALHRVDAYLGAGIFVLTEIDEVQILPGVEVIFWRRAAPVAFMLVTTKGRLAMRA